MSTKRKLVMNRMRLKEIIVADPATFSVQTAQELGRLTKRVVILCPLSDIHTMSVAQLEGILLIAKKAKK